MISPLPFLFWGAGREGWRVFNPGVKEKVVGWLRSLREGVLQIGFPPLCVVCDGVIYRDSPLPLICSRCWETLTPVESEFIEKNILSRLLPCYLDGLQVGFYFNPVVRALVHHIKYQQMNTLARRFAGYVQNMLNIKALEKEVAAVVPVPLHPRREKERNFNQSEFIARGLFYHSAVPVLPNHLRRIRHTRSQTKLNRAERQENVQGAFRWESRFSLVGKTVVVVDDVVTTGATLNECARVLKENGAYRVLGIALATPPEPEK